MNTPFVFGKVATAENFTDRAEETAHLVENFNSLINTIIISPRRWGKSSLVGKASQIATAQNKNLRICHIDLFNVRNEGHFYTLLAESVIKATTSKLDDAIATAKRFFSRVIPKIVVGSDPANAISFEFNWEELKRNPDEILDLAEKIAGEKGLRIVICIDEFQNIKEFDDPVGLQKRLRSHWQLHQDVAYCLYGSKRHMMPDVFTNSQMPFYKFGDLFFLNKIKTEYLTAFISERFTSTGKHIDADACEKIVQLADNHPYYVQQLAQLSWLRSTDNCTIAIVIEAHTALVEQLSLLFTTITETLTTQQLNYLHAIIAGETSISATETMYKYHISSTMAITRSRKILIEKDIIDNNDGVISFQDPIYAFWLRNYYFVQ